ncbi:unnamed protein product [Zymoseptoria tritici ST99CH_3D1]|nr:unnamed protein product [Zymoseptoria tritici ST99CH_3D1]
MDIGLSRQPEKAATTGTSTGSGNSRGACNNKDKDKSNNPERTLLSSINYGITKAYDWSKIGRSYKPITQAEMDRLSDANGCFACKTKGHNRGSTDYPLFRHRLKRGNTNTKNPARTRQNAIKSRSPRRVRRAEKKAKDKALRRAIRAHQDIGDIDSSDKDEEEDEVYEEPCFRWAAVELNDTPAELALSLAVYLSSTAVRSKCPVEITDHIIFKGLVGNQTVRIYLDSGADASYVSTSFTQKLARKTLDNPLRVAYTDGSYGKLITEWTSVELNLAGYTEELPYFVTELEYDMVLGGL